MSKKNKQKRPRIPSGVMFCVPAYGETMYAQTAETLFSCTQFLTANKIPNNLCWFSAADIVEVRNLFLTVWYDTTPYSHLFFLDSDTGFHPMLLRDMINFDKPLMGALYAKRQMEPKVVGSLPEGHGYKDIVNGFMKANALGTGVMMISREVIDTMLVKMPEVIDNLPTVLNDAAFKINRLIRAFDPIKEDGKRFSEDISFCKRWEACGGEIWANVDHKISHIGHLDYHLRYAGVLERRFKEEEAAKNGNVQDAA